MTSEKGRITAEEAKGLRTAKELEGHLAWLNTFTPAALGVLAIASGIYTYLGVSSILCGCCLFHCGFGRDLRLLELHA